MTMRIALFGQAAFGKEVLERLLGEGHQVVGIYAPPEGGRPDPLAEEAARRGLPLFRHRRMRRKGRAIPERVDEHAALEAELVAGGHSPSAAVEERQAQQALRTALRKLTSAQQQVIILRFGEGLKISEVSQIMGKSEGAVKILQHRAIKRLQKLLEQMGT